MTGLLENKLNQRRQRRFFSFFCIFRNYGSSIQMLHFFNRQAGALKVAWKRDVSLRLCLSSKKRTDLNIRLTFNETREFDYV